MTNIAILKILKIDLHISADVYDEYLENLIIQAQGAIENEGIKLQDSVEDGMLVGQYAAYLYRKRAEDSVGMPRYLRYMLNNRLFNQKGNDV